MFIKYLICLCVCVYVYPYNIFSWLRSLQKLWEATLCGSLEGKGVSRRMDTKCLAESFYCPSETITTLLIGYTLI